MGEDGFCACHGQRMLTEGSCEKGRIGLRIRRVTILPHSAVNPVQICRFSCHNSDWHATTNDLAVRGHVSFNSKPCLRSARMYAESGNDFIEDQGNACLFRDGSQTLQKGSRL